jgi:riboflavin kinase / FMN adenylyltransferase
MTSAAGPDDAPSNLSAMEVVIGPEHCAPGVRGSAVTIGAYDGVHIGHRYLIAALRSMAEERDLDTVVVTFDRHPATVVRPESAPLLLTDLEQKVELLAACGVDRTVVVPFDENRANETAEDFVTEVLVDALGAKLVVVGEDFHFGHGRKGNVALLSEMGSRYGFEVVGLGLEADVAGEAVSSTRIRRLLAAGDVAGASRLLGRFHQVRGTVVHGDGRGGPELGFPTANLDVPADVALPGEGIYAVWYERADGSVHGASASVGHRPTFYPRGGPLLLEAFLLDFDGDLYDEKARVSFVAHLRDDQLFPAVDQLIAQMSLDAAAARAVLAPPPR